MKPQRFGIRDDLEKYVGKSNIFPIAVPLLEEPESTPQDSETGRRPLNSKQSAEPKRLTTEITNVKDKDIPVARRTSPFKYFLDGCRRTYHLCDLSHDGHIVPLIAGQFSSAIIERDNETGDVSLYKHGRKSIIIILSGGEGIPEEDAKDLVNIINGKAASTGQMFFAENVPLRLVNNKNNKIETAQDKAIAQINRAMHLMEIDFLETMATNKEIDADRMIVVDGPISFRLEKHHNRAFLEYAIGVSKSFDLYRKDVFEKNKQIGSHLLKLEKPGDRTSTFICDDQSGLYYASWFLRIQPRQKMTYPFAGIIRITKALIDPKEKEDKQISSDKVDYLSSYLLMERHVNPYGSDFRWASHLYPIYLSERIQKEKFLSDHYFYSLLK